MTVRSLAPEASASANSATWAGVRGRENTQFVEWQQAMVELDDLPQRIRVRSLKTGPLLAAHVWSA